MSGIVISYRRDDAEGSAGRLYDRLAALAARGVVRVELGFALSVPGQFVPMHVEQPSGEIAVYAD